MKSNNEITCNGPQGEASPLVFDLASAEFVFNPYPTYRRLLNEAPIYHCEERDFYYVSGLSYVKSLFLDSRASSDRVKPMVANLSEAQRQAVDPLISSLSKWLLFQDPPEHTPVRKLVNQALSSKTIKLLEPDIQVVIDELIEAFSVTGRCELIQDFAYPLPAIIIALVLGVPIEDRDKIKAWSDSIARFLGDKTSLALVVKTQQDIVAMSAYFSELVNQYRVKPTENVISQMIRLQRAQPSFTDDHLIANCIGLIFAGHETTTNLIANTWLTLLNHPEQLELLRASPNLIDRVLEEALRFESPVQRMGRLITEPIELGGRILEAGKRVFLLIGAANRDASLIDEPDNFDILRKSARHLAFGHGIHFCSGAALGRLEAKLAITALCQRLGNPWLEHKTPQWQYNLGLRAMESCPVRFDVFSQRT